MRPMRSLLRMLTLCAAVASPLASHGQAMRLVGRSDLGGAGLNGDVTIVGTTAIVAAGMMPAAGVHAHLYNPYPCPSVSIKLVDLSQPRRPVVVGTIPVPAGVAAHGVSAARVRSPAFTGDLLAVALTMCGTAGSTLDRGVAYYDVTRPATPKLLGRYKADADIVRAAEDLRKRYPPDPGASRGVLRVLKTGVAEFYPEIASLLSAVSRDAEHLEQLRGLGLRSAIIVPLKVRERTVGAITLVSAESGRSYGESDVRVAEDLANRAAVAIESARLYHEAGVARNEAENARAEAEAANKAKSEFLASMSHELRTPLNAIGGYVQLLDEGIQDPMNDNQREYLRRVRRSQEHLLGLINGVLNFAKLEAGHVQFEITERCLRV